jgi:hypothetical protein
MMDDRPDVIPGTNVLETEAIALACGALVTAMIRWFLKRGQKQRTSTTIRRVG